MIVEPIWECWILDIYLLANSKLIFQKKFHNTSLIWGTSPSLYALVQLELHIEHES